MSSVGEKMTEDGFSLGMGMVYSRKDAIPIFVYTPEVLHSPRAKQKWLEDYFLFWEGNFSGAMLNFRWV